MPPLRKISLILVVLVLLPALGYVASRVYALNENEALIETLYDQQLETMLFAVNQHAWDVTRSWAGRLDRMLATSDDTTAARMLMTATPTLRAVVFADTLFREVRVVPRADTVAVPAFDGLALDPKAVRTLVTRGQAGYQQLAPLEVDEGDQGLTIALFFVPEIVDERRLVGFVLDAQSFINGVLAPRLLSVSGGRFTLGIFTEGSDDPVFSTGPIQQGDIRARRALWLFKTYSLGIRLSGVTVEEVVRSRFYRDLVLIGLLAALLLAGTGLVYRNVRREVELARIKSDFVSNVSHELRTPLALIRMYTETLEMGRVASDEKRARYYHVIGQETDRLTRLINNILNFSHIESGRKTYKMAPTDLNAVIRDVLDRYTFTLEQQGFDVHVRLDDTVPEVRGDAEALAEAIINLIDNAVKYSAEEKTVTVSTGRDGVGVYAEVADAGIGIAPEEQARIFDAFYRASDSLVHDTKGTGLGLALVHHIMEAHGGTITVDSRPGQGSRFRLRFVTQTPEEG